MKSARLAIVGVVTATALLVCSAAFSEADQTQPPAKPPVPQAPKKTASSATHKSTILTPAKSHPVSSSKSHSGKKSKKVSRRGQQKIDSERAHQIQEALIREHYMTGQPTGKWDATTEDALRRFQAANGWQNKTVPDSRALIKLGLGPNHDHLLNPESAMTTVPDSPRTTTAPAPTPPADSSNQPRR